MLNLFDKPPGMNDTCWHNVLILFDGCAVLSMQGICCEDGLHCCPAKTSCDAASGMCRSTTNSLAISWHLLQRRSAFMSRLETKLKSDHMCPDHTACDDDSTCCQLPDGSYGCCPYPDVCRRYHCIHCISHCREYSISSNTLAKCFSTSGLSR